MTIALMNKAPGSRQQASVHDQSTDRYVWLDTVCIHHRYHGVLIHSDLKSYANITTSHLTMKEAQQAACRWATEHGFVVKVADQAYPMDANGLRRYHLDAQLKINQLLHETFFS